MSVFLERARGRGGFIRCSRVPGSGTLEQFPVRHERVQLKALVSGLGGREGGRQDSLSFTSGRTPGRILQKAVPKGESTLIWTPLELTK